MNYCIRAILFAGFISLVLANTGCKQPEKEQQVVISTDYGDITILLYNSTPKHRDNFIKLVQNGFYDDLLFHRVIENFMIQGGDPASKAAPAGVQLGGGGPGYEIDPEIGAPHLRGALAAARKPSAEKRSSGSQFYIVTGTKVTERDLEQMEMSKKIKYNDVQRKLYLEQGGYPNLDMEYTVFGEVVSGMDVADKISKLEKDPRDRPVKRCPYENKIDKLMRNNMSLYFAFSSFIWFASCMNPMARFTMSAQHAEAPATVNFQNTSEGADMYAWDFGDGTQSVETAADHRYTHAGKYDVKLTATKGKKSNTMTQSIIIDPPAKCLIEITTDQGVMMGELYDATPKHRDNFLKLAEEGYYNGLLFHRVIDGFMIQGGDPNSKNAAAGVPLGAGGPGYEVPAEFVDSLVHIRGAIVAARTGDAGNPERKSSGSQFYIVQGSPVDNGMLDNLEKRKGFKYTPEQRAAYLKYGGTPFLDRDYTVYGIITSGLDVVDKIARVPKDARDRPTTDVKMTVKVIR